MTYSQPLLEQERYVQYTTATVSCSEGYTGGGIITCQTSGNWSSPTLPSCAGAQHICIRESMKNNSYVYAVEHVSVLYMIVYRHCAS